MVEAVLKLLALLKLLLELLKLIEPLVDIPMLLLVDRPMLLLTPRLCPEQNKELRSDVLCSDPFSV